MNITKNLTWLEFLSLFILLRILYIAVKNGFLCEILKVIAVGVASFFAFHFYPMLLRNVQIDFFRIKKECADVISFLGIFFFAYVLFYFIRRIIHMLIKKEEVSQAERWLSIPVAVARGIIVVSLIGFLVSLGAFCDNGACKGSIVVQNIGRITPQLYLGTVRALQARMPKMRINKEVGEYYEVKKNI
ncbi:MAG: CvpA family protein [Candidatus Omnitrophica bacterium]|nr:CvpA family protein [Candidatus Omnitrophota bacterium]